MSASSDRAVQVPARKRIRVVVVDDSALIRRILTEIIDDQPDMEVVAQASDPLIAREQIRALNPDVITLDVEMPKMDGLVFLEKLMRLKPTPVVMVSTLTERGSETTLRALELGAIDFVAKPRVDIANGMQAYAAEIVEKIRTASVARVRRRTVPLVEVARGPDAVLPSRPASGVSTEKLIIIGASTGGTEAIRAVLEALPADMPGILVTQHMPEAFTRSFASRLDALCRMTVKEAEHGERVLPGHAYIAPGHSHLLVRRSGANYVAELSDGPPVNRHRPSVDVLFRSAANQAGRNAIGVILTGMGKDGALGMREMHDAGAWNIAQDEDSCVVFGMPKEAIQSGGVDDVLPLGAIARALIQQVAARGGRQNRV
ncbi:MAG: chemotaxis response regulator protein-glutamate methylesterase [Proteobacteria bacterium]|nr:chemotaxis response regulator protein-glutamate methylesterase [Burkholderiales bacterium]